MKGGKIADQIEGAKAAELTNAVSKHAKGVLNKFTNTTAATSAGTDVSGVKPVRDLNSRLKALVNSAPVMIFIKGTPQQVSQHRNEESIRGLIFSFISLVVVSLVNLLNY